MQRVQCRRGPFGRQVSNQKLTRALALDKCGEYIASDLHASALGFGTRDVAQTDRGSILARLQKIDQHHVQMLSYFLGKMQAAQDGDGTLLDHSMIVYGGSLSDSNRHLHDNLPALLIGGKFQGSRHVRYPKGTPMTNLFLSMLDAAGVRPEKIGDSNGTLAHLSL